MTIEKHSDIDKSVKLPDAVRAAAARSEAIFNQVNNIQPPDPAAEAAALAAAEAEAPALAAQSPPSPPAPLEPPAPVPGNTDDDQGDWEHRYNSMKGRYNRATEVNKQLTERVDNLQNVIMTLQTAPPPVPTQPTKVPDLDLGATLTEEEVRDYGSDFLNVVEKKARAAMAPVLAAYQAEIDSLKGQIKGVSSAVQQDSKAKMHTFLDQKVPDWREINTDPKFISWLTLPDMYSGAIRQELLSAAYAQGDSLRVAAFFNGFLTEEAAVAPARVEPARGVPTPKIPLSSLAAPGRAKSAASNDLPAEKPIFTRAQITAFYSDIAAGKYRGKDAEKNQREREIFLAQSEGRIR